jgi:uncharacterized protein (TIGR02246 family)
MKAILMAAAFALAASAAWAQGTAEKAAKPKEIKGVGGLSSDLENEKTIRKLYADYTGAWNRHDPKAMADFWALDGDYMEPDGRHAKGQGEVVTLFTQEQKTVFKDSKLTLTIETVWFVSGDTALVDGTYEVAGVRDLEGKDVPTRMGHLTALLMHEGGTWKVAAGRAMIPVPLTYREK